VDSFAPVRYLFPYCTVIVDEDALYVETRFADGTSVGSTPNDDPHTMQMAEDLGYGSDTWAMSKDHELLHTWIAHLEGRRWSDTMWRVAHPDQLGSIGDIAVAEEETRVLEFQRQLDKDAPRPWDSADAIPTDDVMPW
jgi:hypothetical protein